MSGNWPTLSDCSLEDAGRRARYAFLRRVAAQTAGLDRICTGHTADDQVETIVMHWLRGSGLARPGRYGPHLPAISPGHFSVFLMPIPWRIAGSGAGHHATIQPTMIYTIFAIASAMSCFPTWSATIPIFAGRSCAMPSCSPAMKPIWRRKRTVSTRRYVAKRPTRQVTFGLAELMALYQETPALARRVIRRGIHHLVGDDGDSTLEAGHIFQIEQMLTAPGTGARLSLPENLVAERGYTTLLVKRRATADAPPIQVDDDPASGSG